MSWNLIRSVKGKTDLRLTMPFGLQLRIGDIVSVDRKTGGLILEGNARSILGTDVSQRNQPGGGDINFTTQSGDDVQVKLRASGQTSTLFEDLPTASAGADISFGSSNSWILAVTGRELSVLDNTADLRPVILNSYENGVWLPDWAIVNGIASVERMTLLASKSRNTNIALNLDAEATQGAGLEASLTANASLAASSREITNFITTNPSTTFFSGLRVKDSWFRDPTIGDLEAGVRGRDALVSAPDGPNDEEFWEDADEMGI